MAQALLAPLAAAAGGTGVVATALPAIGAVAQGLSANAQGQAAAEQNRINAYIGKTRAIQTDVAAREGLNTELGTLRATLAANGQRQTVGTDAIFGELRRVRERDRRVDFGNRMQEASAYSAAARNAESEGRMGLLGGFIKAGPSVFDVFEMRKKYKAGGY